MFIIYSGFIYCLSAGIRLIVGFDFLRKFRFFEWKSYGTHPLYNTLVLEWNVGKIPDFHYCRIKCCLFVLSEQPFIFIFFCRTLVMTPLLTCIILSYWIRHRVNDCRWHVVKKFNLSQHIFVHRGSFPTIILKNSLLQ